MISISDLNYQKSSRLPNIKMFFKPKKVDTREVSTNAAERARKNIEEGRGITLGGKKSGSGDFDFATSNEMWRAALEILDFVPLSSADYGGGIVITDWYNEGGGESVKITIRFLSNEVRVDALSIKVFTKQCGANIDCQISENEGSLPSDLKKIASFRDNYLNMMKDKGLDIQQEERDIYENYRGRWSK